jgi:hypothetical protein
VITPSARAVTSIDRRLHNPSRRAATTIRRPSGDQLRTQVWPRSLVRRRRVPLLTSITPACVELPSLISTAMDRSSGDHAGYPVEDVPSLTARGAKAASSLTYKTRCPSGGVNNVNAPRVIDGAGAISPSSPDSRLFRGRLPFGLAHVEKQLLPSCRDVDGPEAGQIAAIRHIRDPLAVGKPMRLAVRCFVRGQLHRGSPIDIHDPDIGQPAAATGHVRHLRSVRRDGGQGIAPAREPTGRVTVRRPAYGGYHSR